MGMKDNLMKSKDGLLKQGARRKPSDTGQGG